MIHKKIEPSVALKPYIDHYHLMESHSAIDFFPKNRIYTYGAIVLVFHYKEPSLFQERNKSPYIEPRSVMCGQQTSYYDLSLAGKTGMIFIVFKPFGAGIFFKIPMNELMNQNIAFENIAGKESLEIEEKILNVNSIEKRIQHIENYLMNQLHRNHQDQEQIVSIFRNINQSKGQIPVKQLAEISCLSIKQFERKFSELVGMNPKQYLRIVRFQNSLRLRNNRQFDNYTTLAFECGYYDQPHFIHDFKIITGLSPKKFFEAQ